MLELLQKLGLWDYLHRTCATAAELKYRLETEWDGYCDKGSVLYFFTHGDRDQIWLQDEDEGIGLLTLKEWLNCEGCHIHFGGCCTFSKKGDHNLRDLMEYTNAVSVSGYAAESGWLSWDAPALALELLLFGLLAEVKISPDTRITQYRLQELRNIKKAIAGRFPDCKFDMLVR